jgi:hypothetical protein
MPKIPLSELNVVLKVTLRDIEPSIWRRIEVPSSITLDRLHLAIQDSMGWSNCHLHKFIIGSEEFGLEDADGMPHTFGEGGVKLHQVLPRTLPGFFYTYDFSDDWLHDVHVERWVLPPPKQSYPRCLAGARKCPPEDCGGIDGYAELLVILTDRRHPEHASDLKHLGGHFDPEEFNIDEVNEKLQRTSNSCSRCCTANGFVLG